MKRVWFSLTLEARRNVDFITFDVVSIKHNVAEMDAYPEVDLVRLEDGLIATPNLDLNLKRGPYPLDGARKLRQECVPSPVENAPLVGAIICSTMSA